MGWGRITQTPALTDASEWLLTFNEPNYATQSNITPEQAVAMWPLLEATGRKLISPAVGHCEWNIPGCVDDGWLEKFMSLCVGCRIDRIALHFYGCSSNKLFDYLDKRWAQYGKLIWLTEFACPSTVGDSIRFMNDTVSELKNHHVERYAWFATRTNSWPEFLPLVTNDELTALGLKYVSSN